MASLMLLGALVQRFSELPGTIAQKRGSASFSQPCPKQCLAVDRISDGLLGHFADAAAAARKRSRRVPRRLETHQGPRPD